jgi:histidinol dehydrogenase
MLAQCEHDIDARAYLICFSKQFAQKVDKKAKEFLKTLKTKEIAEISYQKSTAVVVTSLKEAIELSNKKAPEHLEICFKDAKNYMDEFTNYGSLFIGNYSAEVFGDYVSGTNHTLPTNQVSRYNAGLSVFDFVKVQTYQVIAKENAPQIALNASILADKEGLFAHKLAADLRFNEKNPN